MTEPTREQLAAMYAAALQQIATLTAARDEANQRYYACYDELTNVQHERDEARAKLATVTALLNQLIQP